MEIKFVKLLFVDLLIFFSVHGMGVSNNHMDTYYCLHENPIENKISINGVNNQDTLYFGGLDEYMDEYYSYNYNYPSSIDCILSFIKEVNGGNITKESYCGEILLEYTIPLLNLLKDKSSIIIDEESFRIVDLKNNTIYMYESPHGNPCEYIKFINGSRELDKFIPGFHSNVLFFDSNNKAIIENLSFLETYFFKLKRSITENLELSIVPYHNSLNVLEYAFYQFNSHIGLSVMCDGEVNMKLDIYKELSRKLQEFAEQNNISKIIFCMPVYQEKLIR